MVENVDGLTNEEMKELIIEQLKDIGVQIDAVEVNVETGPSIVLTGAVESVSDRYLIKKTIMDIDGVEDVSDELVVMDKPEGLEGQDDSAKGGLLNRDDDDTMTEDAFEAVKDGIPYIPPDRPSRDEISEDTDWKKNRRKRQ